MDWDMERVEDCCTWRQLARGQVEARRAGHYTSTCLEARCATRLSACSTLSQVHAHARLLIASRWCGMRGHHTKITPDRNEVSLLLVQTTATTMRTGTAALTPLRHLAASTDSRMAAASPLRTAARTPTLSLAAAARAARPMPPQRQTTIATARARTRLPARGRLPQPPWRRLTRATTCLRSAASCSLQTAAC
jgi:hypothetical protein